MTALLVRNPHPRRTQASTWFLPVLTYTRTPRSQGFVHRSTSLFCRAVPTLPIRFATFSSLYDVSFASLMHRCVVRRRSWGRTRWTRRRTNSSAPSTRGLRTPTCCSLTSPWAPVRRIGEGHGGAVGQTTASTGSSQPSEHTQGVPRPLKKPISSLPPAHTPTRRPHLPRRRGGGGAGYSYSTAPKDTVHSEKEVAEDMYWFLQVSLSPLSHALLTPTPRPLRWSPTAPHRL